jgi:hypothetical protein
MKVRAIGQKMAHRLMGAMPFNNWDGVCDVEDIGERREGYLRSKFVTHGVDPRCLVYNKRTRRSEEGMLQSL